MSHKHNCRCAKCEARKLYENLRHVGGLSPAVRSLFSVAVLREYDALAGELGKVRRNFEDFMAATEPKKFTCCCPSC